MSNRGLRANTLRASIAFVAAGLLSVGAARASVITNVATDGFGDGDRDNNGTAEVAATDPTDVGLPWYYAGSGTSSAILQSVDDSAGIGNGNALQLFNSPGQNNRPIAGHLPSTVSLNDGDSVVLRFDMRLANTPAVVDRTFRFGLYNDGGDYVAGDRGSTDTTYNTDVGYLARVDLGADVSNSTTMDITRDDTNAATILGSTATTLSPAMQSTNTANQLVDNNKHHFEMTITRNGTGFNLSLQEDANTLLTGTDASPGVVGFNFNSVMFTARSNALTDYRFDNIGVDYIAAPEPAAFTLLALGAAAGSLRRKRRSL
jgi:hypothetical protein